MAGILKTKIFAEDIEVLGLKKYFVSVKDSSCRSDIRTCAGECYDDELVKLMRKFVKLIDKRDFFIYQLPHYGNKKIEWLKELVKLLRHKKSKYKETFHEDIAREYLEIVEEHLVTLNRIPNMNLDEKQELVLSTLYDRKIGSSMSELLNGNGDRNTGGSVVEILNGDSDANDVRQLLENSGYIEAPNVLGMGDTIYITAQGKLYVEKLRNKTKIKTKEEIFLGRFRDALHGLNTLKIEDIEDIEDWCDDYSYYDARIKRDIDKYKNSEIEFDVFKSQITKHLNRIIKDIDELGILPQEIKIMIDNSIKIGDNNQNTNALNGNKNKITQKITQTQPEITKENFNEYLDNFLKDLNTGLKKIELDSLDEEDKEEVKRINDCVAAIQSDPPPTKKSMLNKLLSILNTPLMSSFLGNVLSKESTLNNLATLIEHLKINITL